MAVQQAKSDALLKVANNLSKTNSISFVLVQPNNSQSNFGYVSDSSTISSSPISRVGSPVSRAGSVSPNPSQSVSSSGPSTAINMIPRFDTQYRRTSKQKSGSSEWTCDIEGCKAILYSKSSRFRHQKMHLKPETQYTCRECQEKFLIKLDLTDHVRLRHMNPSDYVLCDIEGCGRTFSSNSNLNAHKEIHQRADGPQHTCSYCDVSYFHRSALYRHMRNDHGIMRRASTESSSPELYFTSSPKFQLRINSSAALHSKLQGNSASRSHYLSSQSPSFHLPPRPTMVPLQLPARPIICRFCPSSFHNSGQYTNHLESAHYLNKDGMCVINKCCTVITSSAALEKHKEFHHPHFH